MDRLPRLEGPLRLWSRISSAVGAACDAAAPQRDDGPTRRPPPWLPLSFEIVAWALLAAAVLFLRSRGLRIDLKTLDYTIPPLIPVLLRSAVIGVLLYSLWSWIGQRSPLIYWRSVASWRWLLLTLRIWISILVFTYAYLWLKVCIPLVNYRLWDKAFWLLDIRLHLGFSPSLFMLALLQSPLLLRLFDLWYIWWLPSVSFSIAFFAAMPNARLRRQFILSCVLIWNLGAWIYTAFPAVGPIYVYNQHWGETIEHLPHADGAQHLLWENYEKVLAGRDGTLRSFNPTRGVAAMPSLHVGVHFLLMLWFRRTLRPLYPLAILAVCLTFVGSILTGWHYAVDGYIGILLAWLCFSLALSLDSLWERLLTSARRASSAQAGSA